MKQEPVKDKIIPDGSVRASDPALLLMRYIITCSLLLSGIFVVGGWFWFDWYFARSVLIGSVLVNLSFYFLKRDIDQFVNSVAGQSGVESVHRFEKVKFMLKFYARLTVLGLLIFLAVSKINVNMIGLLVGLSIIVLSVVIVCLVKVKQIYSLQKVEGV